MRVIEIVVVKGMFLAWQAAENIVAGGDADGIG